MIGMGLEALGGALSRRLACGHIALCHFLLAVGVDRGFGGLIYHKQSRRKHSPVKRPCRQASGGETSCRHLIWLLCRSLQSLS